MKIENIINARGNRAVNQFVIKHNGVIYFQSYDSVIAKWENGRLTITPLWDFSNTTRKHFYIFVDDYCYGIGANRESILSGIADGTINVVRDGEFEL